MPWDSVPKFTKVTVCLAEASGQGSSGTTNDVQQLGHMGSLKHWEPATLKVGVVAGLGRQRQTELLDEQNLEADYGILSGV